MQTALATSRKTPKVVNDDFLSAGQALSGVVQGVKMIGSATTSQDAEAALPLAAAGRMVSCRQVTTTIHCRQRVGSPDVGVGGPCPSVPLRVGCPASSPIRTAPGWRRSCYDRVARRECWLRSVTSKPLEVYMRRCTLPTQLAERQNLAALPRGRGRGPGGHPVGLQLPTGRCPVPGCEERIDRTRLMCRGDWYSEPRRQRDRVWRTWRSGVRAAALSTERRCSRPSPPPASLGCRG
jgi:hypothetical protein